MEEKLDAHTEEVERRLNAEIARLKEEHSKKEAEWAVGQQNHQQIEHSLRAQIGHLKREKIKDVEDLEIMTKTTELLDNKLKCIPLLVIFVVSRVRPSDLYA